MSYKQFKSLIESLQKVSDKYSKLYDLGIDTMNYDEDYQKIISLLMECAFNEEGKEWIDWYLYERVGFDGRTLQAWDENNNEICHNIESLWDTVFPYTK